MKYLHQARFLGIYRLGYMELDVALITPLVELTIITIHDIEILSGVRMNGHAKAIAGLGDVVEGIVGRLLGAVPPSNSVRHGKVYLSWPYETFIFSELVVDADDETVRQYRT